MIQDWTRAFLVTLVVELLVATPLLDRNASLAQRAGIVVFAQLASHPVVWFVLPGFSFTRAGYLVGAETWAIVSELLLYRLVFTHQSWARALAVSALTNGASLGIGSLLF